jgi:tagatose 1,6-diphosphate aldolase
MCYGWTASNLKWTKEFSSAAFDGSERQAVYKLSEVRQFCHQLNEAAGVPWVILSTGVDVEGFLVQGDLATAAEGSGILCGQAIWKDAIGLYPDMTKIQDWLSTYGGYTFVRANAYVHRALPWSCHHRYT